MKRATVILSTVLALMALSALMLSIASAAPAAPTEKVTFTKSASDTTPNVGDVLTFVLFFAPTGELTQNVRIQITDPNPAPAYLSIVTDAIGGGAAYSDTIDAIVWTGHLVPGSAGLYVPYQMQVTGIPTPSLSTGYPVTNTATMVDLTTPKSLPDTETQSSIRIMPQRVFLASALRNYRLLVNGSFDDDLRGWNTGQGAFDGHGSGMPQSVISLEGDPRGLLGNPSAPNGSIPVGYGYIAQTFTVKEPYLQLEYRVLSYDIVQGPITQRYFDTFEVSVDRAPNQIPDTERNARGCASTALNPTGTVAVTQAGLVFCGGRSGGESDVGNMWDSGWRTVTLDLSAFVDENITLYLANWSREYGSPSYDDQGWYNTWVYVDNVSLQE